MRSLTENEILNVNGAGLVEAINSTAATLTICHFVFGGLFTMTMLPLLTTNTFAPAAPYLLPIMVNPMPLLIASAYLVTHPQALDRVTDYLFT